MVQRFPISRHAAQTYMTLVASQNSRFGSFLVTIGRDGPHMLPWLRTGFHSTSALQIRSESHIDSAKTHYEVLGLNRKATQAEIKRAYYSLAKIHHPDVAGDKGDPRISRRFQLLSEAYETLSSPKKRALYDAPARGPVFGQNAAYSPGGPYGRGYGGQHRQYREQAHYSYSSSNSDHERRSETTPQDWLLGLLVLGGLIFFEFQPHIDQWRNSFGRVLRRAQETGDPAELRRISFELAPRWLARNSPRPMILLGDLEAGPEEPVWQVEARAWMRFHMDESNHGRELVWVSVDMDLSKIGVTPEALIDGCSLPDDAKRFKSVVSRCQRALDGLSSSGTLKEKTSQVVLALRESYLMCEYNSRTKSIEFCSYGKWIEEDDNGDLRCTEIAPDGRFVFLELWKREARFKTLVEALVHR